MRTGDVVDHLCEQHRLANAGSAKQPGLAAALQWREEVDHFDPSLEDL